MPGLGAPAHGAGRLVTQAMTRQSRVVVPGLIVGQEEARAEGRVLVLETEVDDAAPQLLGPLLDRLLAAGELFSGGVFLGQWENGCKARGGKRLRRVVQSAREKHIRGLWTTIRRERQFLRRFHRFCE